jgi:2Fe-2S ferredoxin
MPKIVIKNLGQKEVPFETNGQSALSILQANQQDWKHACGGKGKCTTCSMIIESGQANLNPYTENEQRFIKLGRLGQDTRLACQTICSGDIEVRVPKVYKLPHLSYSD